MAETVISLSPQPVRKVRALLCLTSLDPAQGGIASVNRNVIRALQSVTQGDPMIEIRALVYHEKNTRISVRHLQDSHSFRVEGCGSNRWRFLLRYLGLCLWWRPDLVFVDHVHLAVVPYLIRRLTPRGYVLFCHGIEFDRNVSWLRKAALRSASLLLSNSRFTARRLTTMFPGATVMPCELGIDELALPAHASAEVRVLRDAFGLRRSLGSRFILITSRLSAEERYKGHDQLIAIMPRIVEEIPTAQLVVAGDGDDLERLKLMARRSKVARAILFSGFARPEVLASLYARCRLFAMPSRGEGFGLVYLEAMRFGKPCIASRVDGSSEVVADEITGILVDPGNLSELRDAVLRILRDDDLAERMGRAGLDRLNKHLRFTHFRFRLRERLASLIPALAERNLAPSSETIHMQANA